MSRKWLVVLIVSPLAIISLAAWIIISSATPAPINSPTAPNRIVALNATTRPSSNAGDIAIERTLQPKPAPSLALYDPKPARPPPLNSTESPTPRPQRSIQIRGAAWLVEDNGRSDILRGLHVQLLPTTIPAVAVKSCIDRDAKEWKELLETLIHPDNYEFLKKTAHENSDYGNSLKKQDIFQLDFLDRQLVVAKSVRENLNLPNIVDTKQSLEFITRFYINKRSVISETESKGDALSDRLRLEGNDFAAELQAINNQFRRDITRDLTRANELSVSNILVASTETDVDGHFEINDISPGNYCLHAEVNLPSCFAEWIILLQGQPQISLSNDNAFYILRRN